MLQIIIGIAIGLILIAFFIAAMYVILPDRAVDKALNFFRNLRSDLLNNTVGRMLEILFLPIIKLSDLLISFTISISQRAGPLAGFSVAMLGILRLSRGLVTVIFPEKSTSSVNALIRATIILIALIALSAVSRVVRNAIKSLFYIPILLIGSKRKRGKIHINKRTLARIAYIIVIILAILLGVHAIATAVEVIRPNSRPAELFKELDLLDKFYLYVIKDIEIRRGDLKWLASGVSWVFLSL